MIPKVSPQKVSYKDASLYLFTLAAESGDGSDVVGDHHQGCSGEVFLGGITCFLSYVHLTKTAGYDVSRQTKLAVVSSVNILD